MNFNYMKTRAIMKIKKIQILLLLFLLIISCGKQKKENQAAPKESEVVVKAQKDQVKEVSVHVMKVANRDLTEYVKITGKTSGLIDVTMRSETNGKVVSVNKKLGDYVKKGEAIGKVDNKDLKLAVEQTKVNLLAAEANFESAEISLKAQEKLFNSGNISELEFTQTKSVYKNAQAALKGAKVSLEQTTKAYNNSLLIAPVSGNIAKINIEIGELLSAGQEVCNIVNAENLIIKTGVSESSITSLEIGQQTTIYHPLTNQSFTGFIRSFGIKPSGVTSSYPVEIEMDNSAKKLYPGMVVEASIKSKVHQKVIYISHENIKSDYERPYVYLVENNTAKKKYITKGKEIGENVIITNGLKPGDILVTTGFDNLEENSQVIIREK